MRVNLAKDPSLRSGTTASFTPIQGATLSVTEDYAFYGKNALIVSKASSNGSGVRIAAPVPVMANKSYAFSLYSRIPVEIPQAESSEIILQVEWLNSLGTVLTTNTSATLAVEDDSTWYRIGGVWIAPTGATFANVKIIQPLSGTAGAKLIFDAFLFEQADYIGGYFDNMPQAEKNAIVNKALSHVPQVINGIKLGADVVLNDLVLNTIDEDDTVWVVTDIDGWWGQTNPELPDIPRGTEDGSYDVEGRLTARSITLSGFFIPKDSEDSLSKATNRLVEALNLVRKGGWLHAHEEPTKAAWVRLASKPVINTINARGRTTFQVTLRAGDPIKYHWNDSDPDGYTTDEYRSADIPDYNLSNLLINPSAEVTSGTVDILTNQLPNPSMETANGTVDVWQNLLTNPSFETANGTVPVWQNLFTNPDFETAGTTSVIRTNQNPNPRLANSITGWATTGPTATIAATATGAQIDVVTGPTSVPLLFNNADFPATVGDVWSASMEVTVPAGYPAAAVSLRCYAYGTSAIIADSGAVTVQPGTTVTITANSSSPLIASATGVRTILYGAATPTGARLMVRNALAEKAPTPGPYFDGGAQPTLRTNWIRNSSFETDATLWLTTNAATQSRSTAQAHRGTASLQVVTAGTTAGEGVYATPYSVPGITTGTPYAASVWVWAPVGATMEALANTTGSGGTVPVVSFTGTGAWQLVSMPNNLSNNSLSPYIVVRTKTTAQAITFYVDEAILETGVSTAGAYFDTTNVPQGYAATWVGATNASGTILWDTDLSTRWQGTANASASELYGVAPAGWTAAPGGRIAIVQSTRAVKFGTKSVRCIPLPGATGDEYIQFDIPVGTGRSGGVVMASRYQEAAITIQAGSFAARALRPVIYTPETIAPGLVNAPGWQDMRVTYPTLTSVYQVRLYHGGLFGSGDVWYDMAALVPSGYTGPYFDGATQPILRTNLHPNPVPASTAGYASVNAATIAYNAGDLLVTCSPGAADSGVRLFQPTVTTGSPVTISVEVQAVTAGSWRFSGQLAGQANQGAGPYTFAAGEIRRLTFTYVPTGSGTVNIYILRQDPAGNETFRVRKVQVENGSIATAYFAGSSVLAGFGYAFTGTANASPSIEWDADILVRWQGTANASASDMYGAGVASVTYGIRGVPVLSSRWTKQGTYSVRVPPNPTVGQSWESHAQLGTYTMNQFVPGQTYTLMATFYQETTGQGMGADARSLVVATNSGTIARVQAADIVGSQDLRVTFTVPASGVTWSVIRLMNYGTSDVWWDLSALVPGVYNGPYFDGSTQPIISTNIALNPCAVTSGINSFVSNNSGVWTVTRGVAVPAPHPQGITTCASSTLISTSTVTLMSMYSVDGLAAAAPARRTGAWFYVNAPGYQAKLISSDPGTPLTQNTWTWVVGSAVIPAGTYAGAFVEKQTGQGNASGSDTAYITGLTAFTDGTTPTRTVAGSVTTPGFTSAWTASANSSPSVIWDADLTPSWTGATQASSSKLTGIGVSGWVSANCSLIQSSRWTKSGGKSLRVIANHPTNYSYAEAAGANVAPAGIDTGIVWMYFDKPYTGATRPRALGMGYNSGNPNAISPSAPNVPGEYELRVQGTMVNPGRFILFSDTKQGDSDVWFDLASVVPGVYSGPSFDGSSTSTDPDYSYVWTGASNASTSALRGVGVSNWPSTAGRTVATSYSQWSDTRSKAVSVVPVGQGNFNSYIEQTVNNLVPGDVYTVYGVLRVPSTLTGGLSPAALGFWIIGTGNQNPTVTYSATATNAPGVYQVRGTFTALLSSHGVRFMNGSPNFAEPVQWDSMGVFEGDYALPYFDGYTPNTPRRQYSWSGVPELSTSKFVGWDEDIVDNIGTAEVSGIFTITGPVGAGTKIYNATTDETMTLQEPLRGAGMVANAYEVESKDQIATIKTTEPHGLRVGDAVSLLGMVIPFSESDTARIVTHVSDVFPYSFSFAMPTDDIDAMSTAGQIYLINNDVLVVDTYTRSVTYNGEISGHRYRLTTLTDWIHFGPGENVIEYLDDVTEVEVTSKAISGNVVTLTTEGTHYFIPGEEINVQLPVDKSLAKKSLTGNVVTLTTAVPHGYSVGDVVDVASTETSTVVTKSRTSNVATLTTSQPHGVAVSDSVQVNLPASVSPMQKQLTSNVVTLTSQQAHGFSVGDSVTVALPTSVTITNKQLSSGQVILTTATAHNFAVGDTITVAMPAGASVVGKARAASQIIITTSAAHGFSVGDQVIVSLPTAATPTGNFVGVAAYNLVTITTTAAHGFSVGDRISIAGSTRPAYNGEKIVETVPSGTTFTFRDWTLTADLNTAVGSSTITNITNQSYNGTKTIISASGTTFAYNL